jgi:hypothetical protein
MLKKGLEDGQVLSLHREILKQHAVVKNESKPKDVMAVLKTAVVRSDTAQRRLLLENENFPSDLSPFEELLSDGWDRYKNYLKAAQDCLSSYDKQRTNGEVEKAISLLELHSLAKDSLDSKRPVQEFFQILSRSQRVLEEHLLQLSANGSTSTTWKEITVCFQDNKNACSYKAVAQRVEEACTSLGRCFIHCGDEKYRGEGKKHGGDITGGRRGVYWSDSDSSEESAPRVGASESTDASHASTFAKSSESEYRPPREEEGEDSSVEGDCAGIPTFITICDEVSSLGETPRKKRKVNRTRRKFTAKEKEAVINGVQKHGKGNWSAIKQDSNGVLASRSTIQIKDLHRTLITKNHAVASSPMFGKNKSA